MFKKSHFSYLPVGIYGSVMGLTGFSVALHNASKIYGLPDFIADIFTVLTILAFIIISIAYGLKILSSYDSFKAEFTNPLTKSFFGTFIISLLLLPILINPYFPKLAFYIWVVGTVLMFTFSLHIVSFWITTKHDQSHLTPAWIIPVVGTFDIPLATHLFNIDVQLINILAFSIGIFFTFPIVTLILSRVVFFEKLPTKLMPTLMILVAPFSVGFLAYLSVTHNIDLFAMILYFLGLFIFFTLLPQLTQIASVCPFRVTWWAISFPIAALINSTLIMYEKFSNIYFYYLGIAMLVCFGLIFLWLIVRTIKGILARELEHLS